MNEQLLDQAAQAEVVRLAWKAIRSAVYHESPPPDGDVDQACERHPGLAEPAGAFVTVYVRKQLRGCLGEIETTDRFIDAALRCAVRTPVHDYRFEPVHPDEFPELTFKVSRLTPPQPLDSADDVRIGVHGLIVRYGGLSGLLLPEVPVEYDWDVPTFLRHLWRKAGISPEVPIQGVSLYSFQTQIMSSGNVPADGNVDGANDEKFM